MPAIRTNDPVLDEMDEDDGMPPLVDNPNPSMTFTFFTDMRPITCSDTTPPRFEVLPDTFTISTPPESPVLPESQITSTDTYRSSHGKKRDASYIPRPPNAFILFRSSFIRSQQVPGKVEGNHSTLSKIIGMYWRTLPREEREVWEAKALVAQAEHRKRYPDWRFRPGANAMAKLKIKDGPGTNKRRSNQNSRKNKGEGGAKGKEKEKRCAKIADLLVEGKTGLDLEAAVKEWEGDLKEEETEIESTDKAVLNDVKVKDRDDGKKCGEQKEEAVPEHKGKGKALCSEKDERKRGREDPKDEAELDSKARCKTPGAAADARFKFPLTAMFKRSLSAPARQSRTSYPSLQTFMRRDSFTDTTSDVYPLLSYSSPVSPFEHEAQTRGGRHDITDGMDALSPLLFPSSSESRPSVITRWSDPFTAFDTSVPFPDLSPVSPALEMDPNYEISSSKADCVSYPDNAYSPSSYSTLKGWAGDTSRRSSAGTVRPLSAIVTSFAEASAVGNSSHVGNSDLGLELAAYEWPTSYDDTFHASEVDGLQQYSAGLENFGMADTRQSHATDDFVRSAL